MPCCKAGHTATVAAYALTSEKQLQQEDDGSPVQHQHGDRCFHWVQRTDLDCLGSSGWSVPLGVSALSLAVSWYVIVPFFIDAQAMHWRYAFKPMSVTPYTAWGTTLFVLIPLQLQWVIGTMCGGASRVTRWMLYISCGVYLVLLLAGNALGASQTAKRLAFEPQFAARFNAYYCDSRTLRVCLDGPQDKLLVLIRGNNGSLSGSESTTDAAALAVWTRCQQVIAEAMGRAHFDDGDTPGDKEIEAGAIYRFIDDCVKSSDMDAWCGDLPHRTTPLTDEEHLTLPSPYAENREMYQRYTNEWSRRMLYSNVLLGSALGCQLLAAWSWKVREPGW
ncbi:hypothetical protein Gpo141_00000879 [Globisporangium polare]